jgi:AcrR family transcriptional regulator
MITETAQFSKATFENLPSEKRYRILKVATEEFANNGFENTSIQQIAKKSNISVGSIYKYFPNKEGLFSYIVQEGLSTLEKTLLELAPTDEDILIKAEKIIRKLLAFSKEKPEFVKLYCSLTTGGNSDFLNQISQRIEAVSASIYTQTIAIAQETGEVRKDVNPAFFAYLLDNVFMMLQFSTACPYYRERFFIYTGKQATESDELIVEQTLLFLKAAFNFK